MSEGVVQYCGVCISAYTHVHTLPLKEGHPKRVLHLEWQTEVADWLASLYLTMVASRLAFVSGNN